jgi:hypothetical protein
MVILSNATDTRTPNKARQRSGSIKYPEVHTQLRRDCASALAILGAHAVSAMMPRIYASLLLFLLESPSCARPSTNLQRSHSLARRLDRRA